MKKAISVGTSAALLASLLATAVAPAVLGASTDYGFTVTGAGSIPTTGTSGAVSIAVNETEKTGWNSGPNTLTFTLNDADGNGATVAWSGTPAITGAPGSLGTFTTTKAANVLTVHFTTSNTGQIENFSITGLTIDTDDAAIGAIDLIVDKTLFDGGTGTIATGTGTASGTLSVLAEAGDIELSVAYDTGSFSFGKSGPVTPVGCTAGTNGNLQIAAPDAETRAITSVTDGTTALLGVPAITSFHDVDTAVTQSVGVCGLINGIGTVVKTITQTATSTTVQPGEFNQVAGTTTLTESDPGTFSKNMVVTFTLDTAGVLFSAAPVADPNGAALALNSAPPISPPPLAGVPVPCALSFDRKSCAVTVTAASTTEGTIVLGTVSLDLEASVAQGTNIGINVTTVPVAPVVVDSNTIAKVGRVLVGVSAAPTIYINENDQQSGMIVLTESRAGVLTDTAVGNYFGLCIPEGQGTMGTVFTRAPWAVVTAGNLSIRSDLTGGTSVAGTIIPGTGNRCVEWVVYTKSTTASTIEIRGSDASNVVLVSGANNGPRLSVAGSAAPGAVLVRVLNGSKTRVEANSNLALVTEVSNATKAFRNQPAVASLGAPLIPAGAARAVLGGVTIKETQAGQFKANERICVSIVPLNLPAGYKYQTYFITNSFTADQPVVSTNTASGLLVKGFTSGDFSSSQFCFSVSQQATGTLGVITISNMVVFTAADASVGNINVNVSGGFGLEGQGPNPFTTARNFEQVVTVGKIGVAAKLSIGAVSALGLKPTSGYTTKTPKTAALGKYITWKFTGGAALAGQRVNVMVAMKIDGAWGGPKYLKSAVADANGIVTFAWKSATAAAVNVRVQWPGNANYAVSTSKALGGYWK
jgi:hypothetical protein